MSQEFNKTHQAAFFYLTEHDLIPTYVFNQEQVPPNCPVIMALGQISEEALQNIIALMKSTVLAYESMTNQNQPMPAEALN
jgi:hypothetical protein